MSRIGRRILILLLPFLLYLASGTAVRAGPIDITVMTQNLYVGADSDPLLKAPDQATAVAAATAAFQQVLANNFPARAAAIAGEIQAAGGPLLIGLQEAALISGPGTPPLDYAQILLKQLKTLGLNYTIVGSHTGTTVGLAGFSETDRDIVLARTGIPGFTATGQGHDFRPEHQVPVPTPVFGTVIDTRGYVLVDATLDGVPFQFVSTHLDPFHTSLQPLQAGDILAALSGSTEPQLVVGDFNADDSEQTYREMIDAGFVDVAAAVGADGATCCQAPNLSNPASELSHRYDYIFERGFSSIDSAFLIGNTHFEEVPPIWPSDHAGLVATVDIPEPSSAATLAASMLLLLSIVGFGIRSQHRISPAA